MHRQYYKDNYGVCPRCATEKVDMFEGVVAGAVNNLGIRVNGNPIDSREALLAKWLVCLPTMSSSAKHTL